LGSEQAGGLTTSGRPVLALTLALNHAMGGRAVAGYHVVNLLIHAAAGVCLFGLVRRTLVQPALAGRFAAVATTLAFIIAALWTLHPLQTESVTYIVQRAESLAGLFYLLTLYAFVRSTDSPHPRVWWIIAFLACLLGAGSKEVLVSAPVIVACYDRAFISDTWAAAWRRHRGLYLMLGLTWLVLAGLIFSTGGRGGTAGFSSELTPWTYALTQCGAIVRYLALSFWPGKLVFDYGLITFHNLADVLPEALLILVLLGGVSVAMRRWPAIGFLGVFFFAVLAPSSSFVPVITQTMAEHRMYLPLAALATATVLGVYRLSGARTLPGWFAVLVALAVATASRNLDYRSEESIWRDTALKLPSNARAHNNLGQALFRRGDVAGSMASYRESLRLQPKYPETHYNLAVALAHVGRLPEALEHYEAALRFEPDYVEAHNNYGNALVASGRVAEALPHYERALAVNPRFAEAHNNLGNALLQAGRAADAEARFMRALELRPDYPEANYNLGNALAEAGRMTEALARYERAVTLKPGYTEAHINAGNALLALERPAEAVVHYERAVALQPQRADAQFNLGSALLELGRWHAAIPPLEAAVRLDSAYARAYRALGFALARAGRMPEAMTRYEEYVKLEPADAEARTELRQLREEEARRR
jgi:tetratricopeptide (TPR) repeat protein